jgi:hypothetical protein
MSENSSTSTMKFHLIKGNLFRVIHADGAIGGITPSREIFFSLFSERGAIPTVIEQTINADGSLGGETGRACKDGIVREIEVGVMLNAQTAKRISEWLAKQAEILAKSEPELAPEKSASSMELS